jgi:hypothetical protein
MQSDSKKQGVVRKNINSTDFVVRVCQRQIVNSKCKSTKILRFKKREKFNVIRIIRESSDRNFYIRLFILWELFNPRGENYQFFVNLNFAKID